VGKVIIDDDHFRKFAAVLEKAIDKYGDVEDEDLLQRQRNQIESLVSLETKFRKALIEHSWGLLVYKSFVHMIKKKKNNILAARPYFRERQSVFTNEISKALKKHHAKSLYKFHFNYIFVMFVMQNRKWPENGKLAKLARQIAEIRQELIEMNMPLAINRARIFWSSTPKSHLSYMDLIQISCEGLTSAIDKFVLPYSRVFRAVMIGRILGNFIEQYSETLVHFYPIDKRKLYRANKIAGRFKGSIDYDALAADINKHLELDKNHKTTASEIADLMAASSCVSSDSLTSESTEEEQDVPHTQYVADTATQPDVIIESANSMQALSGAMEQLTLREKKLLRLKGVSL
jgi:DNA-directed RNA polymerase specialized sigma subunit